MTMTEAEGIEAIARICHDANAAWCRHLGEPETAWDEADIEIKESAKAGVKAVLEGVTCSPANQHEHWMVDRLKDGWKYGEKKNRYSKEHPCLLPYAYLGWQHKMKDQLFRGIVETMANAFLEHGAADSLGLRSRKTLGKII